MTARRAEERKKYFYFLRKTWKEYIDNNKEMDGLIDALQRAVLKLPVSSRKYSCLYNFLLARLNTIVTNRRIMASSRVDNLKMDYKKEGTCF